MASKSTRPFFTAFATALVTLIILGALALAGLALMENMRFSQASNQIFGLVNQVRVAANDQKGFAQNPGEDLWNDLAVLGRIPSEAHHLNPWGGEMRATTLASGMRIENDLPVHECRRLALYFLDQKPAELGLFEIDAQSPGDSKWMLIYAQQAGSYGTRAAELACGTGPYARLGLIFKTR